MARIRSIKPEFWSDAAIAQLDHFTRLLYIALWNFADDEGRGRAIAKEISGFAFPFDDDVDNARIEAALQSIAAQDCIVLYEINHVRHFQVRQWKKHQKINRPTASRFSAPENYELPERSLSIHGGLTEPSTVVSRNQEVGIRNQEVGSSKRVSPASAAPASALATDRASASTYVELLLLWNFTQEQIAYGDQICARRPNAPPKSEAEQRARYMKAIIEGQMAREQSAPPAPRQIEPKSLTEMAEENRRTRLELKQKGQA